MKGEEKGDRESGVGACRLPVCLDHFHCVSCHSHSSLLFLSGSPTGVKKMLLLALTLYHLFHHGQQIVEDIEAARGKKKETASTPDQSDRGVIWKYRKGMSIERVRDIKE